MSDPVITFEESRHAYTVNGRPVMSVTKILEAAGISDFSMVPREVLWHAQERGKAVHRALHFEDEGDLDESTVAPEIIPYVEAWRRFRRDCRFVPQLIEHMVYCRDLDYIGMLDRKGILPVLGSTVLDIKTGEESESWPIQLAAYVRACVGKYACRAHRRLVVKLNSNGSFRLHWYEQRNFERDFDIFRRALEETRKEVTV